MNTHIARATPATLMPSPSGPTLSRVAFIGLFLLLAIPGIAFGQTFSPPELFPGYGFLYGEGRKDGEPLIRFGLTTGRFQDSADKNYLGSTAIIFEKHENTLEYDWVSSTPPPDEVELKYRSLSVEVKRYFNFIFLEPYLKTFWGVRGGYTEIEGRLRRKGQPDVRLTFRQLGPLFPLALPLMLEHPGFIVMALFDGVVGGLSANITPSLSLEYQSNILILPHEERHSIRFHKIFLYTQFLQLIYIF